MGTVSYSFRIDNETKEEFDEICQIMGMSSATAFNMFAKRVVAERALPFTPAAIPSAKRSATEALQRIQKKTEGYNVGEDEILDLVMSGKR